MPFQPQEYSVYGDPGVTPLDRKLVTNLLRAAHADRRLTDADYAGRLRQAELAGVFDDLVRLTRDLMGVR